MRATASKLPATSQAQSKAADKELPPPENGDRPTRPEFERRYEAMPHVKKAELIEGIVYLPSPVRQRQHSRPHFLIMGWLGHYVAATPGVDGGDNGTVRLDLDNEPQPDAFLRIETSGSSRISEEDYVEGPPELVVEVASSSDAVDLHDKKQAYRRNGVQEYLVWLIRNRELRWFVLREGRYERMQPDEARVLRSEVFPGLWLDEAAMLAEDLRKVLERLNQGLASPEHAVFVQRLGASAP
jgi:Uma2 family endonuclease